MYEVDRLVLTPKEVAQALGVSKDIAYDLIQDGAIKSLRVGRGNRAIRVPVSAVTEYLDARAS